MKNPTHMNDPIRIVVVGCGNMGTSHARAYHAMEGFEITGLVSRSPESREKLSAELGGYPTFASLGEALSDTPADAVSVNTYPDTHAAIVREALDAGCHVFVEKPLALTVEEARELVDLAHKNRLKLVVGYILRVHPAWSQFVEIARTLGKPLVMRMNLNQQSSGATWYTHRQLMQSMSPIVDCGVHYVDIMCLMTGSRPVSVSAIGARLSDEIDPEMYNYGQLQVRFEDGSVGWYEAGWGPMVSETAFFIKDVMGPKGSVSIQDTAAGGSDDVEGHTQTGSLRLHHSATGPDGEFLREDEIISTADEPDHDGLCRLEQEFFLDAIRNDADLGDHLRDAVNSLRIVLAADASYKSGKTVAID
ncbi:MULTISPECIES: Gfo/Idh/MocA family protein [Robiginitalea]|uniref:Gfo/Idh/MocA family protein n=1 Tax=Robiginitalea TaxID=252306 RepID=UPI00234BC59A|nr:MULTISPECIES: Gfo/Idh/MocA family oxidoreductase [unclassified Robiginitalea]MDC6353151.1 Gfo/Idh/MocA family oxidoreductase [Robiginitalea sp. PM2]MDC6373682.1 Gfo/Idh/MocA family oxidoreductase [Robiginitalea sp. SP8]